MSIKVTSEVQEATSKRLPPRPDRHGGRATVPVHATPPRSSLLNGHFYMNFTSVFERGCHNAVSPASVSFGPFSQFRWSCGLCQALTLAPECNVGKTQVWPWASRQQRWGTRWKCWGETRSRERGEQWGQSPWP